MSIATQALDGVYGRSAAGVRARLERAVGADWQQVSEGETDIEGNVKEWMDEFMERGLYRLVLATDHYFAGLGMTTSYPEVTVMFRMHDECMPYHIQVVLAPHSYTTYFGVRG
ncbi:MULTISPECIES: hydroxyisourate hydrolase [Streptosporangium]|uniref:Hydroxyisourate hydrolase n=1 Tax=Streptosporangium amethystogenes subsp. fukuiense TaxID=698418 RepID=A0ABW2SSU9_9ACTN|nr:MULTISPECIES: hydroxyisourate hydrolase [unclassified Streptosporangium]WSA27897.1 hydroxyisourate hydrolase [Streptosporangium sp. NBC_01810]WSD00631.1 hydroxyisourate hydrolase [Streptosporangium sp. NBC_01755]